MTKSKSYRPPPSQLYLVVQALPGEATVLRLSAALQAAHVASVLFVPPAPNTPNFAGEPNSADAPGGPAINGAKYADTLKPLIGVVQERDVAALLLNDIGLAKSLKADGLHLNAWLGDGSVGDGSTGAELICGAREILLNNYIIGGSAGPLRDDAMMLGERGADYVGFGLDPLIDDKSQAIEKRLERVRWWAEIFEIPSVAFDVESPEQARELAQAGADFVAFDLAADLSAAGAAELVAVMAQSIKPAAAHRAGAGAS